MTTISAVIKKELKQAFPKIKFSVTTKRDDVRVEWEMTLGTPATKEAVKEICKRHETVQHHGNLMDDTAWSSGISIYCYPSYTQEREDWAVAGVVDYNFANATWESKYERFVQADGKEHYHATKLYYSYRDNGVASGLVDEYGNEPSCKRWYYEKLNPPAPQPEPEQIEQVELEIEAPIVPLRVYKVENEVYIQANFPSGNKRHWIDEYRSQATNVCQAKITEVVHLNPEDYQTFIYSFLNDQEWLAKKGGSGSHYTSEKYGDDYDKLFCDELETEKWRRECYELSILVTDGKHYVLANPEGYNYARCVGLEYLATLGWVLEKCNVNLTATSLKNEPIQPETTESTVTPVKPRLDPVIELYIELITEFKGVVFSVKPRDLHLSPWIDVEWELPLGTAATVKAVEETCKRHETVKYLNIGLNGVGDMWKDGVSIYCNPSYSQERKDWAKSLALQTYPMSKWDDQYERFIRSKAPSDVAQEHFMATELYHDYLKNGVTNEPVKQPQPEPETLPLPAPETNLISFPSPKQPEPQPATQPQSDDGDNFYLQSYQEWVNKLVARGEYGKIKSFGEWYAIAVEVM